MKMFGKMLERTERIMKKKMRSRWLCLLMAVLLAVSLLAGCGKSGSGTAQESSSALMTVTEDGPAETESETPEGELTEIESETPEGELTEIVPEIPEEEPAEVVSGEATPGIDENGSYTTKEDVALYIHTYGKLPPNFITKKQAEKLGWSGGSLEPYAPGKCIGGNYFGNYEGILPDGEYRECDIDTLGKKSRGAKRLIYSDDGRIYYTGDHYKSFTQLY